jgi:hypothetical protein
MVTLLIFWDVYIFSGAQIYAARMQQHGIS